MDAHHHLWNLTAHRYRWLEGEADPDTAAWLGDYRPLRRNHVIEDYLRDAAGSGLTKSVHVQAGWSGPDSVSETRWLQETADRHGMPNGIVAEVDLTADDAAGQLERRTQYPNLRGVRMLPMTGLVTNPRFRRGFALLRQWGLSYDLNTRLPHMQEGVALGRAFPDTFIVIGNTGNPMDRSAGYVDAWRAGMRLLATLPNVAVKISGLGMSDHR